MTEYLNGVEELQTYQSPTQVYKATHDGIGKRLSLRDRSFISFTYGGKVIEDFNLIAYTEDDSLNRPSYANFEDISETYDVIDGQIYWGTHFTGSELTLNLITDGIEERELDEFKRWFTPGIAKELVLAEHPNRAIMARIAEPPQLNLLPFEQKVSKILAGQKKETSITLYKGTIELHFIADEPFWHSRYNLFVPAMSGEGVYGVIDVNQDPFKLKLLLDGLATSRTNLMVAYEHWDGRKNVISEQSITLSDSENMVINTEEGYWYLKGKIWVWDEASKTTKEKDHYFSYPSQMTINGISCDRIISIAGRAITWSDNDSSETDDGKDYVKMIIEDNIPHISMFKIDEHFTCLLGEDSGAMVEDSFEESKIFNPFSVVKNGLKPGHGAHVTYYGWVSGNYGSWNNEGVDIGEDSSQYLYYAGTAPSKPKFSFNFVPKIDENTGYIVSPANKYIVETPDYPYLAIDNDKFYFTTPALLTGYNQAIYLCKQLVENTSIFVEFLNQLREKINEYYSRAWAINVANFIKENYVNESGSVKTGFKAEFITRMKHFFVIENNAISPVVASFNSKTGEATCQFTINIPNSSNPLTIVENTGDMVKSSYLIIEGRNYPNAAGFITPRECHSITTNYEGGLQNFSITYKNMYY